MRSFEDPPTSVKDVTCSIQNSQTRNKASTNEKKRLRQDQTWEALVLVVGGVPEHFNLPWRVADGTSFWASCGVDVKWEEQPGGTGQMLAALASGDLAGPGNQ